MTVRPIPAAWIEAIAKVHADLEAERVVDFEDVIAELEREDDGVIVIISRLSVDSPLLVGIALNPRLLSATLDYRLEDDSI